MPPLAGYRWHQRSSTVSKLLCARLAIERDVTLMKHVLVEVLSRKAVCTIARRFLLTIDALFIDFCLLADTMNQLRASMIHAIIG